MKIVALTGAGISAESGIKTFRDCKDGLWNNYKIEEVASPVAWQNTPQLVTDFYNERRKDVQKASPNNAHYLLAKCNIPIITQNVDNLHERAGSKDVLHLHGELLKARSCIDYDYVIDVNSDMDYPSYNERGELMRPHIVWFGEDVPLYPKAEQIVREADVLLVVGTSLNVYPAAGLIWHLKDHATVYCIDPSGVNSTFKNLNIVEVRESATVGVEKVLSILLDQTY